MENAVPVDPIKDELDREIPSRPGFGRYCVLNLKVNPSAIQSDNVARLMLDPKGCIERGFSIIWLILIQ